MSIFKPRLKHALTAAFASAALLGAASSAQADPNQTPEWQPHQGLSGVVSGGAETEVKGLKSWSPPDNLKDQKVGQVLPDLYHSLPKPYPATVNIAKEDEPMAELALRDKNFFVIGGVKYDEGRLVPGQLTLNYQALYGNDKSTFTGSLGLVDHLNLDPLSRFTLHGQPLMLLTDDSFTNTMILSDQIGAKAAGSQTLLSLEPIADLKFNYAGAVTSKATDRGGRLTQSDVPSETGRMSLELAFPFGSVSAGLDAGRLFEDKTLTRGQSSVGAYGMAGLGHIDQGISATALVSTTTVTRDNATEKHQRVMGLLTGHLTDFVQTYAAGGYSRDVLTSSAAPTVTTKVAGGELGMCVIPIPTNILRLSVCGDMGASYIDSDATGKGIAIKGKAVGMFRF